MQKQFKTSLDNFALVVTITVSIIFAGIIVLQIQVLKNSLTLYPFIIIAGLLLTYIGTFAYRPIGYSLTESEIIIHRPLFNKTIPRSTIKSVKMLEKEDLKWSIRTFGVGGLFGYYGRFVKASIGSMTWYATRRDKAVLITTIENQNIVLTPNNYKEFEAELRT